ncbi:MAG: aldehyde dehydrogenase family protein [Deltaproteobacteria bacterium]|nr:aldehyde dehydrogenase family protein [Deltaproteobacteria bacterium]
MDRVALDQAIATLQQNKEAWVRVSVDRKVELLEELIRGTAAVADRQVAAAAQAKGLSPESPLVGEDYLGGPVVTVRNLRLLAGTLRDVARYGRPRLDEKRIRTRAGGQVVVEVFPLNLLEKFLYPGFSAEVWMQPGVTPDSLPYHMAHFYRQSTPVGRVALVLGAGNVASIGPLDVVHKLFVEGQVCLLKMNPVNEYLGPFIEEAFAPLVRQGFVRVVYGGPEAGEYLCTHPGIDEIHITGSDKTHDAIVFGTGKAGADRKRNKQPQNARRITSELGNVSPIVVVPGLWSDAEVQFQAENIVTQMTNNVGFNCNAAKVIVTHEKWPQRRALLDAVRKVLRELPQRRAYYPGAEGRYDAFVKTHPQAEEFGTRRQGELPWALIPGVSADNTDEACFTTESFCGVTAETTLPGADAAEFLAAAVQFCNTRLWGTLNAEILVHPASASYLGQSLDQAIADLRYGTVSLNHWPAMAYALGTTTWGAYPGHTLEDIQSGIGVVHNAFLFDKPEKTVVRGPFRMFPKPPWFVTHKQMLAVGRKLLEYEQEPSLKHIPSIAVRAIFG